MNTKKIYFRNLDSIRFIAAAMVFLSHGLSNTAALLHINGTFWGRLYTAAGNGPMGVSIFFVLSGFLITYLILKEIELTNTFSVKNFYLRRIFRIWPLYYAVIIFSFVIYPLIKVHLGFTTSSAARPAYFFTFLSNFDYIRIEKYFQGHEEPMQNITWSVAVEEQFYAFWPLIFAFLPRKYFGAAIILVGISSMAFRFYVYPEGITLGHHTLAVLIDLATGAFFAYLIITYKNIRTYFENIKTPAIFLSFLIVVLSLLYKDELFSFPYGTALSRLYFALLFGFIIASQSMIKTPSPLELGNIGIANKLGKYTYGIYLLHPITLLFVAQAFRYFHFDKDNVAISLIIAFTGIILGILLSILSYNYFEKPFLKLKNKFSVIVRS